MMDIDDLPPGYNYFYDQECYIYEIYYKGEYIDFAYSYREVVDICWDDYNS